MLFYFCLFVREQTESKRVGSQNKNGNKGNYPRFHVVCNFVT